MIKCQFCHTTHVANTIFCNECGNYLLKDEDHQTDPLEDGETNFNEMDWHDDHYPDETDVVSLLQRDFVPHAIRLEIGELEQVVEVSLDRVILLGRVDPATNVFPEVDLSQNGHFSKSISRRHAQISKHDDMVVVEDLSSVNGTFVNGKRLTPYLPEPLADGDTLHLAKLPIKVKIRKQ